MADFERIVPVLKVSDMQKSVDFYTCVLGFSVAWRAANDGGGENCMLQAGATALLLSTGTHLGDRPQFTGTLYFQMSGVREFFERVKGRAEVVWPLEATDYGQREFGIRDGDGERTPGRDSAACRGENHRIEDKIRSLQNMRRLLLAILKGCRPAHRCPLDHGANE